MTLLRLSMAVPSPMPSAKADLRTAQISGLTDSLEIDFGVGIATTVLHRLTATGRRTKPHRLMTAALKSGIAITGNWQKLEFDQAPPLTSQQYFWSDEHATFVDEVGFDPLGQEARQRRVRGACRCLSR